MIRAGDGKEAAVVSTRIKYYFNKGLSYSVKNDFFFKGNWHRDRLNSRHKGTTARQKLYVIYLY